MARLLLFGGTTEAREILERGIPALCCVATDYGADLIKNLPNVKVRVGRLDSAGIGLLIQSERISCVLDATHPYATEVTKNIRAACENTNTPLFRVSRALALSESEGVTVVRSCREAAEALNRREGNALLTVGSKELREFAAVRDYQSRLFARVLPTPEVLRECGDLGFDAGHIIAMKGPFSFEMNRALLKDTGSSFLVTKDGGASGGTEAKFKAARELGVEVILIARPEEDGETHTVEEGILWARRMLGRTATLLKCGARVRAVSPVFRDDFPREATRIERPFEPGDLEGASLAVAASDDREINQQVGREAKARAIPVSVADCAAEGSFYFPSLVASGEAAATVSTGGLSCSLTRRLADRLRAVWESWVAEERGELEKDGCAEHGQE